CWMMARLLDSTSGRYVASTPAFFIASTSGPTSVVPKSTDLFVYAGSRPASGTAYFWMFFAAAVDDADAPYDTTPTFLAPAFFISCTKPGVYIAPYTGAMLPRIEISFSLPGWLYSLPSKPPPSMGTPASSRYRKARNANEELFTTANTLSFSTRLF